jgi:group I intron endonuclease
MGQAADVTGHRRDVFKAYKVTNRLNGRAYIGITRRSLRERWHSHLSWARGGRKGVLADAMRECGEGAFVMEHLASARTWKDLCEVETALICQERTMIWDGGYNVTQGGEGMNGYIMPESQREAIRARMLGIPKSPESRAKLALAKTGSKHTAETKAKMSAAHSGRPHSPDWVRRQAATLAGRPKSPEHRAKLSIAKTGQKASAETRAKLSALKKGRKLNLTPEQRAKRSEAHTGLRRTTETRARISAARRAYETARRAVSSQERLDL